MALIYPFLSWQVRYTHSRHLHLHCTCCAFLSCQSAIATAVPNLTDRYTCSTERPYTYTYTHCALPLGRQSPHAFKIASALVGGLSVYFLLGGLITEYAQ